MGRQQQKAENLIGQIVPFAQNGEYFFKKGLKYYRRRELYKAKKYFQRAIQYDPNEPIFLCQQAAVLAELSEFEESNTILKRIIDKLDSEMYECYYFLANNYAYLGLFQEAKKYANQYLKFAPDGEFYEDTEDLIDLLSIESSEMNIHLEETDEENLILQQENARELLENGKLEEASEILQQLISDYPEFWSAYNNLALAQFYLGNVKKAIKLTEDVLQKNEGNLHAMCNLAVFFHYLGREKAVEHIVAQLNIVHPIDFDQRSKLGVTFALLGKYEFAYRWLRWLQKFGYEGDVSFYYWLSISAFYTDHNEIANDAWNKVVRMNPEKRNAEPWLNSNMAINEEPLTSSLLEQFKETDNEEKKCLLLFLLMEAGNVESLEEIKRIVSSDSLHYLEEFTNHMLNKLTYDNHKVSPRFVDGYNVIDTLEDQNGWSQIIQQKIYILWFRVLQNGVNDPSINFKNNQAWAAAVEYCFVRAEEYPISQKEIAQKYSISTSTLRKYTQLVMDLI
ncbi:tetratricopeptide repeat protein [Bacillus sp. Marseille-P3661]|uniref:tetratricopeptide repeat protein n=1 Tax=Bacillus sp. Marseille-P3661 TaxID=1936234 RepID=UPI000C838608|nr:tetratricopeptide repeat protein [Bacillus sp. Marseille-P3661]